MAIGIIGICCTALIVRGARVGGKKRVNWNVERRHAGRGLIQIGCSPGIVGNLMGNGLIEPCDRRLAYRRSKQLLGAVHNGAVGRFALRRCSEKCRRLGRVACGAGGGRGRRSGCGRRRGRRNRRLRRSRRRSGLRRKCGLCTCRTSSAAHEFLGGPGAVAHHVVQAQRKQIVFALVKRAFRMPGGRSGDSAAVA